MNTLITTLSLLTLSATFKAIMDLIAEGRYPSDYKWFNKSKSWVNKWKHGNPMCGEKFPGSSTVFVWVTDGWHFFQMLFLSSWQLAIAVLVWQTSGHHWIIVFIVIKIVFGLFFEINRRSLLRHRKRELLHKIAEFDSYPQAQTTKVKVTVIAIDHSKSCVIDVPVAELNFMHLNWRIQYRAFIELYAHIPEIGGMYLPSIKTEADLVEFVRSMAITEIQVTDPSRQS